VVGSAGGVLQVMVRQHRSTSWVKGAIKRRRGETLDVGVWEGEGETARQRQYAVNE
jgi:hypothetical protein